MQLRTVLVVLLVCACAAAPGALKGKRKTGIPGFKKKGGKQRKKLDPADREIRDSFPKLDKNRDGKIDRKELMLKIKEKHDSMMGSKSMEDRFKKWDKTGDGMLDKNEVPGDAKAWEKRYIKMDANKDGKLTLDEFKTLTQEMLKQRLDAMMKTDKNSDGFLSFEEFAAMGMRGVGLANDGPPSAAMKARKLKQQKAAKRGNPNIKLPQVDPAEREKREDAQKKVLAENFEAWDTNGDGKLSADEIKARLVQTSEENMGESEDFLKNNFKHEDKDGDGFIDNDKVDAHKKRDKSIDANKDGKISYEEFRGFRLEKMTAGSARRVETMSAKVNDAHKRGELPISKDQLVQFTKPQKVRRVHALCNRRISALFIKINVADYFATASLPHFYICSRHRVTLPL
jgi:Ca2+-binding EF-hand superfamily protein